MKIHCEPSPRAESIAIGVAHAKNPEDEAPMVMKTPTPGINASSGASYLFSLGMERTSKGSRESPATIESKSRGEFPDPRDAPSVADWMSKGDIEPGDQEAMNPAESMTNTESVGH